MSGETRVLVVANETLASKALAEAYDELIVATHPEAERRLRRDVVGRLRADAGVLVQHVVGGVEAEVPA